MQTTDYELNEIEQDIKPKDFRQGSVYRELVAECGPKAALILSRYHGGGKLHVLAEGTVTEGARKRYYERMKKSVVV